jgi:hypothetical protein
MSSRRVWNSITHNVVDSFLSRNNDIDGYWTIGKLHLLARENAITKIMFDLVKPSSNLGSANLISMLMRYRSMIESNAKIRGLAYKAISIEIEFDLPEVRKQEWVSITSHNRFQCTLKVVDDRDRAWSYTAFGRSSQHDPNLERRSSRHMIAATGSE